MLGLTVYCLFYYIFNFGSLRSNIWEMPFFLLLASVFYICFLIFYEFKTEGKLPENYQQIASDANRFFMTTYFSKFLFPIYFGIFFLYLCGVLIPQNVHIFDGKTFFNSFVDLHMNMLLPIYMFCELYLIVHTRAPKYIWDIAILGGIILCRWILALIFKSILVPNYSLSLALNELGGSLLCYLLSVNGYFLYDYILFKKDNPNGNYSVMIEN